MNTGDLATYEELAALLASLPMLLREARRARRLSLRAAAEQIGVSYSTIHRLEYGGDCERMTAVAILGWLDRR